METNASDPGGNEPMENASRVGGPSLPRQSSFAESVHLGHCIVQVKFKFRFPTEQHLWALIRSLFASFIAVNGLVFLINQLIISNSFQYWNFEKNFAFFEYPYEGMVKDTIPFLQQWYRGLDIDSVAPRDCMASVASVKSSHEDYVIYPTLFREDSIMILAQAGTYNSADNIAEYVSFAVGESSPYISKYFSHHEEIQFKQFDKKNKVCEFRQFRLNEFTMNASTTLYAANFNVSIMTTIYMDTQDKKLTKIRVFFSEAYLEFVFSWLANSDNTRRFVCSTLSGPCANPVDGCQDMLKALPSVTGPWNHFYGNTQRCRTVHAVFANSNPENHCAHNSFTPMLDPKNQTKCQESKKMLPTELFESDFEAFETFQLEAGINPELG